MISDAPYQRRRRLSGQAGPRAAHPLIALLAVAIGLGTGACASPPRADPAATPAVEVAPTPQIDGLVRERREVVFASDDGVLLAGELALPLTSERPPLVLIFHHSGPVTRDAYGYMAEQLLRHGYAVFRFDKRGTGASAGAYGCCEASDALAAYKAAVAQDGLDPCRVLIVAQSVGTRHVAARFAELASVAQPLGVALLSNLLGPEEITSVAAPVHIIVAASEPDLEQIGPDAVSAHAGAQPFEASLYVAEGAEHTLFDITAGPIDWSDPTWVERYHRGAMASLIAWLDRQRATAGRCSAAPLRG